MLIGHDVRLLDPVLVQVRPKMNGTSETSAVFIFNTGEYPVQRSYSLASLGLQGPLWVLDWIKDQAWPQAVENLSITLDAHNGAMLCLSKDPFAEE